MRGAHCVRRKVANEPHALLPDDAHAGLEPASWQQFKLHDQGHRHGLAVRAAESSSSPIGRML